MMVRVLKICASVGVIIAVSYLTDLRSVVSYLRAADLAWLTLSAGCLSLLIILMAWRWQMIARQMGFEMKIGPAIGEYYLSQLVNQTLPGGVTGDAARAVRARGSQSLALAAKSVVFERLIGQIIFSCLMCLALGLALLFPGGIAWPQQTGWILGAIAGLALITWYFGRDAMGLASLLQQSGIVTLSLVISFFLVLGFYSSARAIGAVLPLEALFTLIPLVLTAMLIPLSIGGWGWREGAAAALFPLAGVPSEAGVAAAIAYGALMLLTSLPAFLWLTICALRNRPIHVSRPL